MHRINLNGKCICEMDDVTFAIELLRECAVDADQKLKPAMGAKLSQAIAAFEKLRPCMNTAMFAEYAPYLPANRYQELVFSIANYLTGRRCEPDDDSEIEGWGDDGNVLTLAQAIAEIEEYGVPYTVKPEQPDFDERGETLIINAIRHFKYRLNPWNDSVLPDLLEEYFGFTQNELKRFYEDGYLQGY